MAEAHDKGNALELAVKAIEEHILRAFPEYKECTFELKWKKRIRQDGATDEIDVFIAINRGDGQKSNIIFECKNRQEKADKNDVVLLAVKTDDFQAEAGFLVARAFTRDARARARRYPKVNLITATELLGGYEIPSGLPILKYGQRRVKPDIDAMQSSIDAILQIPQSMLVVSANGTDTAFSEYIAQWGDELLQRADDKMREQGFPPPGSYVVAGTEVRRNLLISGNPIRSVTLHGKVPLTVKTTPVVSAFDVSTRGRYIGYAPYVDDEIETRGIQLTFVTPPV